MERLKRVSGPIEKTPRMKALSFDHKQNPHSIINAMRDYQAMMDAMRSGLVNKGRCDIPSNLTERSNHLKSFAYFQDCSVVGITKIDTDCHLKNLFITPTLKDYLKICEQSKLKHLQLVLMS